MAPQGMAGAAQSGLAKVKTAVTLLQESLTGLPIGSEEHKAVMDAITKLARHVGETGDAKPAMAQQQSLLAHQQAANPNAAILAKLMGGGGAPPDGGMPPMQGAA